MERTKHLLILLLFYINLQAAYKLEIYKSYINNDMDKWQSIIDEIHLKPNKTNQLILELINYQYGYIAWCIGNEKKDIAKRYLKLAYEYLSKLEKENFNLSDIYAYKSAFVGFEIGLNPFKAPFIGSKSIEYAIRSLSLDSLNYLAYIQLGNAEYYKPKIFGGSKQKAIKYYLKALRIMEYNKNEIKIDWNYLNLIANIGKVYFEMSDYDNSKKYFEKVLQIEPNFTWVKNELYPELLKKWSQK